MTFKADIENEREKNSRRKMKILRWGLGFLLGIAVAIPTIHNYWNRDIALPKTIEPHSIFPKKDTPEQSIPSPENTKIQPVLRDRKPPEIYFPQGGFHMKDDDAKKVLTYLDEIPSEINEEQCQIFIICSGDSLGSPEQTLEVSRRRAGEVKGYISTKTDASQHKRWKNARIWSFGDLVTPGPPKPGGEDYNCRCTVKATTDAKSIEDDYGKQVLKAATERGEPKDNLKDYEIIDYKDFYIPHDLNKHRYANLRRK
jgi:hypothetical protein